METLYSVDAYHLNSPTLAAQAFAREYWAQPRKIRNFMLSPMTENYTGRIQATFNVANGTRSYLVRYQKENRGISAACWIIEVAD